MSLIELLRSRFIGQPLPVPADIPDADLPAGVRLLQGTLIPRIGGLLSRLSGPASAVTLGSMIVVHPRARLTPRLLAHEMEHVRQWREDALFPLRYSLATLRFGYHQNPYEVSARAAEAASAKSPPIEDLS
ncbi:MAG: DUF4157 domain-containing protein [Gemmatimonadetes bacterium]|nr:DUF4157 domain-containing protein [Gemmatimonadota bacterium]